MRVVRFRFRRSAAVGMVVVAAVLMDGIAETLAEHWDGHAWTIQTTPNPSGATGASLLGVSCTAVTACTAVGDYVNSDGIEEALAEHWDGHAWTIQTTPNPSGATGAGLLGVSCTSVTACTAVGSYTNRAGFPVKLVERYSG